jgi:hypothetical protein
MNKNIKPTKKSLKEKICIFLVLLVMMSGIYFIATGLTEERNQEIEFINQDYAIIRGIVTKKSTYKGHSIQVKYIVDGKYFEDSDGFNENDNVEEGDSVSIKYSKSKPELMITEFNEEFNN